MALTGATLVGTAVALPGDTLFFDMLQFDGPTSYTTGGEEIHAFAQTKIGTNRTIVAVIPTLQNGYVIDYDRANLKLIFREGDYAKSADDELTEVDSASNLATLAANCEALIISV